ncbi:hypothetical protein GWI33_019104 [Rhynchophorus ferrugineus]|uniref:Uncharacterized protein n=1 Tax=Rhynchophorus ferrugineus TaxID=354439 RepID=A0A834HVF8_RHYFE|nr:hypothetical protein GWI33_019104 [Rhynchophorus ferrugineus]
MTVFEKKSEKYAMSRLDPNLIGQDRTGSDDIPTQLRSFGARVAPIDQFRRKTNQRLSSGNMSRRRGFMVLDVHFGYRATAIAPRTRSNYRTDVEQKIRFLLSD